MVLMQHLVTSANGADVLNDPPIPVTGLTIVDWAKWSLVTAGVAGIVICVGILIAGQRTRNRMAGAGAISEACVLGGLALASVAAVAVGAIPI